MNSWDAPSSQSSNEKSTNEKNSEDSGVIPNGALKNKPETKHAELETLSKSESVIENATMQTEKSESSNALNGLETIGRSSVNTIESTTAKTKSISVKSSIRPATVETQSEGLLPISVDLNKEICHSMNSLNQLEGELFESMKGLRSQQADVAARLYDPERTQTAISCGQQIVNAMRTKLDLMKFAKELNSTKSKLE
jgi:hypothetical protein